MTINIAPYQVHIVFVRNKLSAKGFGVGLTLNKKIRGEWYTKHYFMVGRFIGSSANMRPHWTIDHLKW